MAGCRRLPQVTATRAAALSAAMLAAVGLCFVSIEDRLIFNDSASMPRGFYLRSQEHVTPGAIVTVRAGDVAYSYARTRNFTDEGDRFLKRVAASAGDAVCADGAHVSINGQRTLTRAERDGGGHTLPHWSGCRVLNDGEVLLLGDGPDSFDGRYWGPTPIGRIEGVWRRL